MESTPSSISARASAWQPESRGPDFEAYLEFLPQAVNREEVREATAGILGQCPSPTGAATMRTGLVVGCVQSGKTSSFTALAAMAVDNGYRMVVVITGTTNNLADQSRDRLMAALGIGSDPWGRWVHVHNPDTSSLHSLRTALSTWHSGRAQERRVVLVTVLKRFNRIDDLENCLSQLPAALLGATLIIDDEADQASLNTLAAANQASGRSDMSATYASIAALRSRLPHHAFLEYTATPQANLFISLADALSAEFVYVLEPGSGYIGAVEVMREKRDQVFTLPASDIPSSTNRIISPPASLFRALAVYVIGVASGCIRRNRRVPNRSMLVHPTHLVEDQDRYTGWIRAALEHWGELARRWSAGSGTDPEVGGWVTQLEAARNELARTVSDLESLPQLLEACPFALSRIRVEMVNSWSMVDRIPWNASYGWIVVGGKKLDRGVTVEGLTVTYMPRPLGTGQADTLQQRARFYGYRSLYLDFCRLYLEGGVIEALNHYVDHERHLRALLARVAQERAPLQALKRAFILDASLRPTRANILSESLVRDRLSAAWIWPRRPHAGATAPHEDLLGGWLRVNLVDAVPCSIQGAASRWREIGGRSLAEIVDQILVPFNMHDLDDAAAWQSALIVLARHLEEHPEDACDVLVAGADTVSRRASTSGAIDQLMEGPRAGYGGDASVHRDTVAIQLHRVEVYEGLVSAGQRVAGPLWVPAVWIPRSVGTTVVRQSGAAGP